MTDHLDFERPPEWDGHEDGGSEAAPAATNREQAQPSTASLRTPTPQPVWPQSWPQLPRRRPVYRRRRVATAPVKTARLAAQLVAVTFGVVIVVLAVIVSLAIAIGSTQTQRTFTPAPVVPELAAKWMIPLKQLRPELTEPYLVGGVDGSFDTSHMILSSKTWIILSSDLVGEQIRVHGVDPNTGTKRWDLDAPQGKCVKQLVDAALVCAIATGVDKATGLGTTWRLMRLDPDTGAVLSSANFEGWLTLITVQQGRLVLVEQRLPAPHAVITVMNSEFGVEWRRDLVKEPNHRLLFSTDRITHGGSDAPDGPALDRPRIRQVANGLTALWSGQGTAFIDVVGKRLVGFPKCSRLVDDGKRLWCNDGDVAVAYSYSLHKLYQTPLNIRLVFPRHDLRAGEVIDPVFMDQVTGAVMRVDLTNGKVVGPLVPTELGSAFGLTIDPESYYLNGVSYISDQTKVYAVKAVSGEVLWTSDKFSSSFEVSSWGGQLLFTGLRLYVVNPADGSIVKEYRPATMEQMVVDGSLVGVGFDELALLNNP